MLSVFNKETLSTVFLCSDDVTSLTESQSAAALCHRCKQDIHNQVLFLFSSVINSLDSSYKTLLSPISQEPVSSPATGDLNLICNQSRGILKSVRIIRKASTSQWDGYICNFSNVRHRKTEKLLFHQYV